MQNEKILIDKNCHYLSDSICHLPSHKIINKGINRHWSWGIESSFSFVEISRQGK